MAEQFVGKQVQILNATARTTAFTSDDLRSEDPDEGFRGVQLIVNVTTASGFTITPSIEGKGPFGNYYTLLTGAAITASGTTVLRVFPGATPSPNATANDHLPLTWRVKVAVGDATAVTYTVAANLLD